MVCGGGRGERAGRRNAMCEVRVGGARLVGRGRRVDADRPDAEADRLHAAIAAVER